MSHSRAPLLLLLTLAGLLGCSPVHDWREVRVADGALVALFPCKPQRLTRSVPLAGNAVDLELVSCSAGGTTWSVTSGEVSDAGQVGATLSALRESRAGALAGRETDHVALVPAGATPHVQSMRFTVEGQRPDGSKLREISLVFARDSRVFQVAALGPDPSREAVETWIDSLKLAR